MSYQLKVKSEEAGPWGISNAGNLLSRYVTFKIQGGASNWEIANSYIEFGGTVNMSTLLPAINYNGQLTFGYVDAVDVYRYSSGCSVFVRHAWMESSNLGKIESKRYANLINEHFASLQKSTQNIKSQDYSGGVFLQIVNNNFICRLQLSDLFELAKELPIVDLNYIGDVTVTLELEVVNDQAIFLKYEPTLLLPADGLVAANTYPMDDRANAPDDLNTLLKINGKRAQSSLHIGQVYRITWTGTLSGNVDQQTKITNITETNNGGNILLTVTIAPPLTTQDTENLTNILFLNLDLAGDQSGVDNLYINNIDLVMYKPLGLVNLPQLSFREMLVDTDILPAVETYHKQFSVEPNVELCIFMHPKENQFVNLHQNLLYYRNQINGYDTIDRDVYRSSGLYYDRIISNMSNIQALPDINTFHISEKMPLNGQYNTLNINTYYTAAVDEGSIYLFKHQQKLL